MSEDDIFLTHLLSCSPVDLLINKPKLTEHQQQQFDMYRKRRQNGEPLQYIIGSWGFHGLQFKVNAHVLIPRPETEILVEEAIRRFKGERILDLGTGSGCIAVTMAKFLPQVRGVALDISQTALAVAQENAAYHGVAGRIQFICEDMKIYLTRGDIGVFDLIVTNPPYIPQQQLASLPLQVQHEPALALDGGIEGLDFYRVIIKNTPRLLSQEGCLMMEFGDGQADAIRALAAAYFKEADVYKDLTGRERFVICH